MLHIEQSANHFLVHFFNVKKLNVLNAKKIENQLVHLARNQGSIVTLDMSNIKFIDSTGFEVLLNLYREAETNNSRIKLIHVGEDAMDVIKLMEFDKILNVSN